VPYAVASGGSAAERHLRKSGVEEIQVLVDWEVQPLIAKALEGAKRASNLVRDRITQISVQRAVRDGKKSRNELSDPSSAARKAKQAVLDAARGDPISDSQLERLVRLALGKKTCPEAKTSNAVVACIPIFKEIGGDV
jgi:hypothetical protein